MNRIHWSEDEKELVVEAMAEKLQQQPRTRYAELWEAGNALLPPDRRRKWYSGYSGVASTEHPLFENARKRAMQPMQKHVEFVAEHLGESKKIHIPMQTQQEVTWVPVPTPQPISELSFETLLAEVIKRVIERFAPQEEPVRSSGVPTVHEMLKRPLAYATPGTGKTEYLRPIRIALCGPLKDQFNRVKERINGRKVELVHVDNQKSVDAQDWKGGIDYAVVTRFMRHSHSELANQYVGKERVHWVPQGTDSIVAKISELVPGSVN